MADVKWIKITTNIFDDEKILLIESLPDAYAIITVWFKLLCLAGKQNNSGVFMLGRMPYTESMLATIFRMKEATVTMALKTFEQFGMIEIVDGVITIPNWDKHQSLDKLELAKEQTRQRVARHREKQKLLAENTAETECNATVTLPVTQRNADVTPTEEDKEKEKDLDLIKHIVAFLNEKADCAYKPSNKKTVSLIRARMAEGFTEADFRTVIEKKCAEWKGTDMEKYLRPETLFGTKFEGYLNAKAVQRKTTSGVAVNQNRSSDLDDIF